METEKTELIQKMKSGREINKVKHRVRQDHFIYVDKIDLELTLRSYDEPEVHELLLKNVKDILEN